ncbi:hypothetical protein HY992_03435 [Candidatus Micrarchaeota archaeon]|nr:hypothetical protein [Candidatus Micrarchaeota archaeon]
MNAGLVARSAAATSRPTVFHSFSAMRPLAERLLGFSCQRSKHGKSRVRLPSTHLPPAWIIDEILRREREKQQNERPQPQLEIPVYDPSRVPQRPPSEDEGEQKRGVVIIQL